MTSDDKLRRLREWGHAFVEHHTTDGQLKDSMRNYREHIDDLRDLLAEPEAPEPQPDGGEDEKLLFPYCDILTAQIKGAKARIAELETALAAADRVRGRAAEDSAQLMRERDEARASLAAWTPPQWARDELDALENAHLSVENFWQRLRDERDSQQRCAINAMAELERLREALREALEYADDLRGYTHDWDWKYGEMWDAQREALDEGGG